MLQEMGDLCHEACIIGCNVACSGARKEAPSKRALISVHCVTYFCIICRIHHHLYRCHIYSYHHIPDTVDKIPNLLLT
jgi:hypothetical protein